MRWIPVSHVGRARLFRSRSPFEPSESQNTLFEQVAPLFGTP